MTDSRRDPIPDAAIAEAFRDGASTLRAVAVASKLLLREPPSDAPSPILKPVAERNTGRYQVLGEIARGGVGVVLKGHDVDLGRDVAMKVLRDEHAKNSDVVQRFVEEAQIGGQLQHPGIVPVYELGAREDGRPYFAMKLVKGRTLSALLAERKDVAADRAKFVSDFERVCQTVAYAHSRGVIHRDIKPSNVMVGAFGEVQVVDWGLAKVLRQGGVADERRAKPAPEVSVIATVRTGSVGSESVVGSVLGTPAYMPPEQARGMVDSLDEKSDVFSLGAVLCEILTGKPPYACDSTRLLQAAAKAELDDAFARLDACGADEKLVRICKGCLAAARGARPSNAGELAEQLATYLAAVEERVRRAEIESAKSSARADAERGRADEAAARADAERGKRVQEERAKRMTLALAGVVLAAVVGGGATWRSVESSRRERLRDAERRLDLALEEAQLLHRKAVESQEPRLWDEADAAARRADVAASAADLPSSARDRAALFQASFGPALAAVRAAAAASARGLALQRSKDDVAATEAFRQAIRLAPGRAAYHTQLAGCLERKGDWRGVAAENKSAFDLDPSNPGRCAALAFALIEISDYESARKYALQAVEMDPLSANAFLILGNACAGNELWDDAIAANEEALRCSPGWASAQTNLTVFKTRKERLPPLIARALAGGKDFDAAAWYEAAFMLFGKDLGRFGDAVACIEKWMALSPDDADKVWECDRYNAACYAARAGAGEGRFTTPIDDAAKSEFRAKARKWLAADVAEWKRLFEAGGNVPPTNMIKDLSWAKEDGDLAPIRDEEFTSKWSEDERKACASLWTELDAVLAKAKAAAPPSAPAK
jgi:tetratricopeptide (TPR) repeat protein